jgi:PleD family two-component response regulator
VHPAAPEKAVPAEDRPLRLLLIRNKPGDMPWFAHTVRQMMAPVEIVQVVGVSNALWRLGQERFDTVLLDLDVKDRRAIETCRRQIGEVAQVPVLNLQDEGERALSQAGVRADQKQDKAAPPPRERPHRVGRLPWQRRPKPADAPGPRTAAGALR